MVPTVSVDILVSIIQACRKQRRRGTRICTYMLTIGLQSHVSVGNHLFSMLVELGNLSDALWIFDNLLYRHLCSWNSVIIDLVTYGELEQALTIYSKAKSNDSIVLNGYAFLLLLKACVKLREMEIGRQIHDQITQNGLLEKDVFLGSTLVELYAEQDTFLMAQATFENLPLRDIVTWAAMMVAYVNHGCGNEALHCFANMQEEGISPDATIFTYALKACIIIKDACRGENLYGDILRLGLERNLVIGTTLVDMFVKCDSLVKAQEVFDMLGGRNVVSWNIMIIGYMENGRNEEAFECLKQVQSEGTSPDNVTYLCCLKASAKIRSIHRGEEIFSEMMKRGLEIDVTAGNTLVDMYVKCGCLLTDAQQLFNKLRVRNSVSWNVLIGGYVDEGHGSEVFVCLKQMEADGILPDIITYSYCLRACGISGDVNKLLRIHNVIISKGFERDIGACNSLIDVYSKRGLLDEARETFDKLLFKDIVSWNMLIAGYVQHGCLEEATHFLTEMESDIGLNAITFSSFLKSCCNIGAITQCYEMHNQISQKGLEGDNLFGEALVDSYARVLFLVDSRAVFDKLEDKTIFSCNALIGGYVLAELYENAFELFCQMQFAGVSPDVTTFLHCLRMYSYIGTIQESQKMHGIILRQGLDADVILGSSLISMYAKLGLLADAEEVFHSLPVHTRFTWTAIVTGYIELGCQEEVKKCLERIRYVLDDIQPDVIMFGCILRACCFIKDDDEGMNVHFHLVWRGLEGEVAICTALIDMYIKLGRFAEAEGIFNRHQVNTVYSWTSLITGYICHGHDKSALELFERMQKEFVAPDDITFSCTLQACSNIWSKETGDNVFSQITGRGLERDTFIANGLVDMYANCGLLGEAENIFDTLIVKTEMAWTTLITGYAQAGESESVFASFHTMLEENMDPSSVTFVSILNACSHAGLVEIGEVLLSIMSTEFKIIPTLEHCSCMVDLFGRAGHLDKALVMAECMSFHPVIVVWQALMGACCKWGNVELGLKAFQHSQQLDEDDTASFICMINMYESVCPS